MLIDRRAFVAGAALLGATPTFKMSFASLPAAAMGVNSPVFLIDGWSAERDGSAADRPWIAVSRSWRAAWR
jgi:hypothetical protein